MLVARKQQSVVNLQHVVNMQHQVVAEMLHVVCKQQICNLQARDYECGMSATICRILATN